MNLNKKYQLYEESTQDPEGHIINFTKAYREHYRKEAKFFREDFCGSFYISCIWVKGDKARKALALDIDPEPIEFGKKRHYKKLTREQKSRVTVKKQNVMQVTKEKIDIAGAFNFSFYALKKRKDLVKYFRSTYRSLKPQGLLSLEMIGGPDFIKRKTERTMIKHGNAPWFRYFWQQKSFDPVTRNGHYAIHFEVKKNGRFPGTRHENVFQYDWRIWTIPETIDALKEAGFKNVYTYVEEYEDDDDTEGTDIYSRATEVDPDDKDCWIIYLNAFK